MKIFLRSGISAIAVGVCGGAAVALFLELLAWATRTRQENPSLLYTLPFGGFVIAVVYERFDRGVRRGNALILDRIHTLGEVVPFRMAPFVLFGTIITHLGGGSAGREGTAVQMSSSIADQIARHRRLTAKERRRILIAGLGAGFAAAFGTPLAGVFFGAEVVNIGKLELGALGESLLASLVACGTVRLLGVHHNVYPIPEIPGFTWQLGVGIVIGGLAFGFAAQLFTLGTHALEKLWGKIGLRGEWKAIVVGALLLILFRIESTGRFLGLGFEEIYRSFGSQEHFSVPILKSAFTSLTLSGGFKGGEFIPLVFIGSTLGSALAPLLHAPISLLAALGLAACFGAAANTPLAAVVLLGETFGWAIVPYGILACFCAYYVTGEKGIYKGQRIHKRKPLSRFLALVKR